MSNVRCLIVLSPARYPIDGVMGSVLAWCTVDRGFEPLCDQIRDYKIVICCFQAKHAALRTAKTGCHEITMICSIGVTCLPAEYCFWELALKIQQSVLVEYKADLNIILLKINFFSPWYISPWYSWNIAESGVKHQNSNSNSPASGIYSTFFKVKSNSFFSVPFFVFLSEVFVQC